MLEATARILVVAVCLLLFAAPGAFAQATMTLPEYSMPLLTPASQAATAWTNVIPNALASYYTYKPYTAADAVAAGFPPGICGVTEDCYTISVRKFQQQLALPTIFLGGEGLMNPATGLPYGATTWVYGYGTGPKNAPAVGPFTGGVWHFPAPTIRGTEGRPIRVQWLNELPNEAPVGLDPTVNCDGAPYCYPYNRIVTHVHGAHVTDDSDGYALSWFTPGFAMTGPGWTPSMWGPEGTYRYPMTQEASTIWYHDHAMGTTHQNTMMGMAGFFPITDANEQFLTANNILPTGNYELGFALQDRVFDINGQIAMPDYPVYDLNTPGCTLDPVTGLPTDVTCPGGKLLWMKAADGHLIPYVAGDPLLALPINAGAPFGAPSTTLEFFGNMPVVNGVTYGTYTVEARRYRMRFIGGTDSRTWIMKLVDRTTGAVIPFWQIASEQGFLNNPVMRTDMDLMPGERLDAIVDFTGIPAGTKVVMQNLGPDSPYAGPASRLDPLYVPSVDIPEIMEFVVTAPSGTDPIVAPSAATNLRPVIGPIVPLVATPGVPVRNVALEEIVDQYGRTMPTIDQRGYYEPGVPITEIVNLNDTEEWNIINTTVDAHPMHLHLVAFQTVGRQAISTFASGITDTVNGVFTQPQFTGTGPIIPPDPWEAGFKDTVDCPPGMVTTVRAKFDIAGSKYVWHCHILSHEEHDMMRPMAVGGTVTLNFSAGTCASITGAAVQSIPVPAATMPGIVVPFVPSSSVTAVPAVGWHFVNWTGTNGFAATTANPMIIASVTNDMAITANCAIDTFTVTGTSTGNGTITPASQTVNNNTTTTLTVTPDPNYHIASVTGCGGTMTGPNTYTTGPITANCTVTASFAIDTFTVTASSTGNGTIAPASQVVNYNTTAAFTVTPDPNYHIASVTSTCGGTLVGNIFTTGPVTANCAVTASFAIDTFTVTATSTGNGTITPASQVVNYNTTAALTVTPALHYHIASVTSTCGGTLVGNTFTTGPVTANCAVTASFAIDTFAVNFIAGTGGSITGTLNQTVPYGGSATAVTAVPNAGYQFVNWTGTGGFASTSNPLTVTNVTAAMTITANFAVSAPISSVSPDSLAFGDQLVGTAVVKTVTVANIGTAPMIITSIKVDSGWNALALTTTSGGNWNNEFSQTNNCPIMGAGLAPGNACTVKVTFKPQNIGAEGATLFVNVSAPAQSATVALTGTGVSPVTKVSPTSLSFGSVKVGTTSPAKTVTLTNTGNATLFLKNISIVGWDRSQFAQTGTCPIDAAGIAPGASCTIDVTFKPTHKGSHSATLFIDANVPALDKYVSLSGRGI